MKKSSGYICIGRILDKRGNVGTYHLKSRNNGDTFMGENDIQELLTDSNIGNLDIDENGAVIVTDNCGIDVEDITFDDFSKWLSETQLEMVSILEELGFELDISSIDGLNPFSYYNEMKSKPKKTALGDIYLKIVPVTTHCGTWLSCKYNIVIVTEIFEFNMIDIILNSPFKRTLMKSGIVNIENYSEFKLRVEKFGDGHNISKALDIAFRRSIEDLLLYNGQMGVCSEYGYGCGHGEIQSEMSIIENKSKVFHKEELVYSVKHILDIWEDFRLYSLRRDLNRYEVAFIIEHAQRLSKLNADAFGESEGICISHYLYWFGSKLGVLDKINSELAHRADMLKTEEIMRVLKRDCTDGYFPISYPDDWLLKCRYYIVLTGNKALPANTLVNYRYYDTIFNSPLFKGVKL